MVSIEGVDVCLEQSFAHGVQRLLLRFVVGVATIGLTNISVCVRICIRYHHENHLS